MYKGEIEQMFGNLFLNAKVVYSHNTFNLVPFLGKRTSDGSGPYIRRQYYPDEWHWGNIDDYGTVRPMTNANFNGNYFAENVLGADHEIKFGVDYVHSTVSSYSPSTRPTSKIAYCWSPGGRKPGCSEIIRSIKRFNRYSGFVQDTMTFGRLAVNLGLRYDVENSKVANDSPAGLSLAPPVPGQDGDHEFDPGIRSKIFSPRLQPHL